VTISWPFDPTVDAGLAAMSLGYAWLARRVGAPRRNAFYFCIGLLIVWLALETPLDTLADHYLMSAHMAQHMLLMAVAPPFLLLGLDRTRAGVLLRVPLLRPLTEPVPAQAAYAAAMIGWHIPWLYMLALQDPVVHVVEHLAFLAAGTLFWWPVIRATRGHSRHSLDEPGVVVYLLAGMLPMMAVALPLQFSRHLFYPFYGGALRLIPSITPVIDQNIAGAVMMLMEMTATGVDAVIVSCRWLGEAVRSDLEQQQLSAGHSRQPSAGDGGAARR
jgi:putative membrane protein